MLTQTAASLISGYIALTKENKGAIPSKQQLDIGCFTYALPNIVLFAVSKPGQCRVRVIGEKLKSHSGLNTTGRNYYDFITPERRRSSQQAMELLIDRPCATRAIIEQTHADGQTRVIEAVALPLMSDEEGVDGFTLCCDQRIEDNPHPDEEMAARTNAQVLRRDWIDLGFGVPTDFCDIIPADRF
ncbi:PAS domain-containing protein [Rhodovibrionaceae bacterium A322]